MEAAGFPLQQFPFSLPLERWAGGAVRNLVNLGCFQSRGRPQRGVQCGMGAVAGLYQRGEVLLAKHTGSWEATDSFTPGLGGNSGGTPLPTLHP